MTSRRWPRSRSGTCWGCSQNWPLGSPDSRIQLRRLGESISWSRGPVRDGFQPRISDVFPNINLTLLHCQVLCTHKWFLRILFTPNDSSLHALLKWMPGTFPKGPKNWGQMWLRFSLGNPRSVLSSLPMQWLKGIVHSGYYALSKLGYACKVRLRAWPVRKTTHRTYWDTHS